MLIELAAFTAAIPRIDGHQHYIAVPVNIMPAMPFDIVDRTNAARLCGRNDAVPQSESGQLFTGLLQQDIPITDNDALPH